MFIIDRNALLGGRCELTGLQRRRLESPDSQPQKMQTQLPCTPKPSFTSKHFLNPRNTLCHSLSPSKNDFEKSRCGSHCKGNRHTSQKLSVLACPVNDFFYIFLGGEREGVVWQRCYLQAESQGTKVPSGRPTTNTTSYSLASCWLGSAAAALELVLTMGFISLRLRAEASATLHNCNE